MERKTYPSDLSRSQFEPLRGELEGFKKRTSPRKVDLYDIFCAILYLLKNGCTWRAIPGDFPKWTLVRYYFDLWSKRDEQTETSLLERALKKSGSPRAQEQWTQRENHFLYSGCAKRQEHRYSQTQRL